MVLVVGCVSKEQTISEETRITQTEQKQFVYGDSQFIEWLVSSSEVLMIDTHNIADASSKIDSKGAELAAKKIKDDSTRYLEEIKKFKVTFEYQKTLNEYQYGLEDIQTAGKYAESGNKNINPEDLKLSTAYIRKGMEHMALVTQNLEAMNQ